MTAKLPTVREAAQLKKLREIRVQRARTELSRAQQATREAERAVQVRNELIKASDDAMASQAERLVTTLAQDLPRLGELAKANRTRLFQQKERDVDKLIGEEDQLDQAREAARKAEANLSLAISREDVGRDLFDLAKRARRTAIETRAEVELEDLGRRSGESK